MKILEHRALRGPNLHSLSPLIFMRLDIGELESRPSDQIPGFAWDLVGTLPGLAEHRCSPGYRGGFVERLERGTWAGHVVEHVALELQTAAGMDVGFGRTRGTKERGVYTIVYRYLDEEAGMRAGEYAVELVEAAAARRPFDAQAALAELRRLRERGDLGPSTGSIVAEAQRRGIPVLRLNEASYIQLGHGARQQRIQATMTGRTSGIGVEIADDKFQTKALLGEQGVPVPHGATVRTLEGAREVAEEVGYPVVLKPLVGNHGRGITTDVRSPEELQAAWAAATAVYPRVVIERFLAGCDFRILVVNHRFVAAARRDPARVVGNGALTLQQLIEALNADERRGECHEKVLTRVKIDGDTHRMLQLQGLTLESVPPDGQVVVLKSTANLSSGGTSADVTAEVHPFVRAMAERVSRIVGLDIMGLDVVSPTLSQPLGDVGGGVVEVNAAPGFRMHLQPDQGRPRDVAAPVVDMLFPPGCDGRIPVVAVTGTNGKTTTTRLISHILRTNGARVGLSSTSGVEIHDQLVLKGDYSGPAGAQAVLRDPTVDAAVLEVARGGLLRRGLAVEACDVGVLLNVASDHLGEGGIDTLQDLAKLKATVVEAVRSSGTAILNADDPLVLGWRERLRCRVVLFSLDPASPALRQHLEDGGTALTVQDGVVVIRQPSGTLRITEARDIPITFDGKVTFNVANALAAAAAAHALGVPEEVICHGLTTFNPTVAQLPGRMNLLNVQDFKVLLDYGHNVPALRALAGVLPQLARGRRISVSAGTGNRRDEDLREFGEVIAGMYDAIFLCDPDPRGRRPGETPALIAEGLRKAGFPAERLRVLHEEGDAIDAALDLAQPGDLVVLQLDDVAAGIRRVRERQVGAPGPRPAPPAEPPEPAPPAARGGPERPSGRASRSGSPPSPRASPGDGGTVSSEPRR